MMKPITVRQLVAELQNLNQNALVALSTDCEGNGYNILQNEEFVMCDVHMTNEIGRQETYYTEEDMKKHDDYVMDFYGNKVEKSTLTECIILVPAD